MKRKLIFLAAMLLAMNPAFAEDNAAFLDTENPLFFEGKYDFVSRSGIDFGNSIMALHQRFSYGLNGELAVGFDTNYQIDFDADQDGFSYTGLDLKYRMQGERIVSEFFGGLKFGGRARVPEYADTVYFVGAKIGRSYRAITLAGTIQSSWIFDDMYGMAYIDMMPEIYVNVAPSWAIGVDANFRFATRPAYDQEWLNFKVAKQFGRTMYVFLAGYEFEQDDFRAGARVNIIF